MAGSASSVPLGLSPDRGKPRLYAAVLSALRARHHIDKSILENAFKRAVAEVGFAKRVTSHTFRHSFATHLLAEGYDIRTVQELPGHKDVRTTMICTHVLNRGGRGVRSPADVLAQERRQPDARPKQPNAHQDGK